MSSAIAPLDTSLPRALVAEGVGTALLLATVIGSGIMGETLANGNSAIALLANTIATGVMLVVLITMFGPVSGAHFNPAVTLAFWMRKEISTAKSVSYTVIQIIGAVIGVWTAHLMFDADLIQFSQKLRNGPDLLFSESIATFGLVACILASLRVKPEAVPMIVGLYITGAYWFTASTSFANPAVTLARTMSNTFSGIAPSSAPFFIMAQIIGAVIATLFCNWLYKAAKQIA